MKIWKYFRQNPQFSIFSNAKYVFFCVLKFCDIRRHAQNIWQSNYKVLIPPPRVYNIYIAYNALMNTVYSLTHGNWSMRKHCKQVWSRFSANAQFCLIGFCFVFMLFFCIFCILKFHEISCFSVFFLNSVKFFHSPYRGKWDFNFTFFHSYGHIQGCSVENQKRAIAMDCVQQ